MAYQNNALSSLPITDYYLEPDNQETFPLLVREMGGIGLNDPSAGLRYQHWTLRYFPGTGDMVIEAPNTPQTILFTRSGITEIDLAFDQNMNPFVCFVENGQAKFWWFDTNISATVFSNLPASSITPRCCLDDKRETQTNFSDIILCYVLNGKMYMRRQRDRYTIQYLQVDPFVHPVNGLPAVLVKIGMHQSNRLQWTCGLLDPPEFRC